jgi:hypothetical protein
MTPARGITTANKSEVATETVSPPREQEVEPAELFSGESALTLVV